MGLCVPSILFVRNYAGRARGSKINWHDCLHSSAEKIIFALIGKQETCMTPLGEGGRAIETLII